MKFGSGATGIVHGAELSDYENHSFLLSGSTGVIRMQGEQVHLFRSHPGDIEPDSGFAWRELAEAPEERPAAASTYCAALDELLDALEGTGTLRSDGRVGRRSLEMIMAIYQSQLEGKPPGELSGHHDRIGGGGAARRRPLRRPERRSTLARRTRWR